MALHAPPAANETDAIIGFLGQAQDAFPALVYGLAAEQAARSPSASDLSLGGLVKHVTDVQLSWLAKAEAAPGPVQESGEDVAAYLDSFRFDPTDSLEDLLTAHRARRARRCSTAYAGWTSTPRSPYPTLRGSRRTGRPGRSAGSGGT